MSRACFFNVPIQLNSTTNTLTMRPPHALENSKCFNLAVIHPCHIVPLIVRSTKVNYIKSILCCIYIQIKNKIRWGQIFKMV